jgi:hypothetical protein
MRQLKASSQVLPPNRPRADTDFRYSRMGGRDFEDGSGLAVGMAGCPTAECTKEPPSARQDSGRLMPSSPQL